MFGILLMVNVEDPSQTTFYIPYKPAEEEDEDGALKRAYRSAYEQSWKKCSRLLYSELENEYKEKRERIISWILTAHEDELPGLPFPQLPLLAVHGSSSIFAHSLLALLSTTAHLHPSEAPNVSAAFRVLVSQFLASDIRLLDASFSSADPLLVVLYDFEQFDPKVMQDVFHICSTRIPALRLTFLAFLASPLMMPSSYIHAVYPRSTLIRVRLHSLSVHDGFALLERLLLATFFDPAVEPDLVLGPSALEAIVDYHTRYNSSVDALITCIQLPHLKHFLTEPLSILIHPPTTLATDPIYAPVLSLLQSRIPSPSTESLWHTFCQHSVAFRAASRAVRLGFIVLHTTNKFFISKGYKTSYSGPQATTHLMIAVLSGRTTPREIRSLVMHVHELRHDMLHALLTELHQHDPTQDQKIHSLLTRATSGSDDQLGTDVSTWLSTYLMYVSKVLERAIFTHLLFRSSLLKPLTQCTLWDIYYTGSSPFPSDLLNPSPRATIISALIRPHAFVAPLPLPFLTQSQDRHDDDDDDQVMTTTTPTKELELHQLPDTSILFWRYSESGKWINIYDWYESFKVCVDLQRTRARAERARKDLKGKGKAKLDGMDDDEEDDEEAWQREVQARFLRALHELDWLGFVQHTKRKAEHVVKTVFNVVGDV